MYPSTIGGTTTRVVEDEESYVLSQGFPLASGFTAYPNQMVKLVNDGTIAAIAASTDKPLGRVVSAYTGNDAGNARVAVPFESIVHAKANGTVAAADALACTGFDTTLMKPIYKTAASSDYVSAIALTGGATTTDITIGILRQPYLKP